MTMIVCKALTVTKCQNIITPKCETNLHRMFEKLTTNTMTLPLPHNLNFSLQNSPQNRCHHILPSSFDINNQLLFCHQATLSQIRLSIKHFQENNMKTVITSRSATNGGRNLDLRCNGSSYCRHCVEVPIQIQ